MHIWTWPDNAKFLYKVVAWINTPKAVYRAYIVPQPWQHLVVSDFDVGANLVGVNQRIMEVLGLYFPDS